MLETIVLSVIGTDRPGLVRLVANLVAEHGGNWLESRMCRLGGQFAGIARVDVPSEHVADLRRALDGLAIQGLRVTVDSGGSASVSDRGSPAVLELVGHDRPGILRTVSGVLASHQVNVEELSSECVSAPMGGGILFQARAKVLIPESVAVESIRADLEKIAADLMVDIRFSPPA